MIRNITKSDAQISRNHRSMLLSSPVFGDEVVFLPVVDAAFVGVAAFAFTVNSVAHAVRICIMYIKQEQRNSSNRDKKGFRWFYT